MCLRQLKYICLAYFIQLLTTLPCFSQITLPDTYVAGGEISYKFISGTPAGYNLYSLSIKIYRDCVDSAPMPNKIELDLFYNDEANNFPRVPPDFVAPPVLERTTNYNTSLPQPDCFDGTPDFGAPICYEVTVYEGEISVPVTGVGYIIDYQGDYRRKNVYVNVNTMKNPRAEPGAHGFTFVTNLPRTAAGLSASYTSSPVFKKDFPPSFCTNRYFYFDFSANDPDGDSLSYGFAPCYQGLDESQGGIADRPPFKQLKYNFGYSGMQPLGPDVQIDPKTGIISGIAPNMLVRYMVGVYVYKWRNGLLVSRHRKEIQFKFFNCIWPDAILDSVYTNCNGLDIRFKNSSTGTINTYTWDFGDPSTNADTSNQAEPVYRYPAPGVYYPTLYLNKYGGDCNDSAVCTVMVDSGMVARFNFQRDTFCNRAIYHFFDTSSNSSFPVSSWDWNFGEPTTNDDVSDQAGPTYEYPGDGTKTVRLIIGNDIGCVDTTFKTINIIKTLLRAPNDTILCNLDTIQLNANTGYSGTYNWGPDYNISSTTSASPLVSPDTSVTYQVTFKDSSGCMVSDNVTVFVKSSVSVGIVNNDTLICRGDSVNLFAAHDALSITWQPLTEVFTTGSGANAVAFPENSTPVIATAHLGSCKATDEVYVTVVPLPNVTVNNDTSVCFGASVYLRASGGSSYSWTPTETLDDAQSAFPVAYPTENTVYTVTVTDTFGCPKPVTATVQVNTFRGLFAIAQMDTLVVEGEPVQLIGSGGQYYEWSPPDFLSNPFISNPVATPFGDITYRLKITNDSNCVDYDSVRLRAFNHADIYVPTAFTPNGDGINDIFRVFPVSFDLVSIKIFDRWGREIYTSSDYMSGWDGTSGGRQLQSSVFVWLVRGKDKRDGSFVTRKGTVMLIR